LFCDTASRSAKQQVMLEIWGEHSPFAPQDTPMPESLAKQTKKYNISPWMMKFLPGRVCAFSVSISQLLVALLHTQRNYCNYIFN